MSTCRIEKQSSSGKRLTRSEHDMKMLEKYDQMVGKHPENPHKPQGDPPKEECRYDWWGNLVWCPPGKYSQLAGQKPEKPRKGQGEDPYMTECHYDWWGNLVWCPPKEKYSNDTGKSAGGYGSGGFSGNYVGLDAGYGLPQGVGMTEKYNSLPEKSWWSGAGAGPNERSSTDMSLKQNWCPTCPTPSNYKGMNEAYGFSENLWYSGVGSNWSASLPTRDRTPFDKQLQQKATILGWCPKCSDKLQQEGYTGEAPWVGPRTDFDKQLQGKWCNNCGGPIEGFQDYLQSFPDTDNPYSYNIRPMYM